MEIVAFEKSDNEELILLGEQMHKESTYRDLDWNPDKLRVLGDTVLEHPTRYCCFVAKNSASDILGFLVGYINEHYFSDDLVAEDMLLFVPMSKRGGKAAIRLVRAYEQWAKDNGAKRICLGVTTEINTDQTVGLYKKLGYEPYGIVLKKEA